jgi:pimeloyl-ACP methyl ester carboxylesterase
VFPSRTVDLGPTVHYLAYDGPEGPPPVVLLHGLGGSHAEWGGVAERLASFSRVLVPDLIGFGRTAPTPDDPADVDGNRRLLERFLDQVVGQPAVLMGSSMGGLIAMLHTVARPETVAGLVLVDPSLPRPRFAPVDPLIGGAALAWAAPRLVRVGATAMRLRRRWLGSERWVASALRWTTVNPAKVSPAVIEAMTQVAEERANIEGQDEAWVQAGVSLLQAHAGRRSLKVVKAVPEDVPTLLLHGAHDKMVPLVSAKQAARLRPDWTFRVLDGLGHLPHLEAPERIADLTRAWMGEHLRAGA